MPENPNIDPETGSEFLIENYITMATNVSNMNNNSHGNNNNNNNNNKKASIPRIPSAGLKYYDIATQLLGKAGSDIEELFIAAARDGVYDRIENFLQRNRSESIVSIDVKDKKTGNTPLIWAAKRGHAKIVQLLLRHGADITLRNYEGHTAVEVASPSIRTILLESVERSTEANHLLLLQAAWQGDIKVVSRLLTQKKVIDVNCKNADGYTPVMLATRDISLFEKLSTQMSRTYNPVEVVAELLSSRADIHATDGDGKTCLHHACQSKAIIAHSVVSKIITGGSELETKDKRCFTPIHCASLTGNAECITTLLDGGSEVNSRGFAGATPLHITKGHFKRLSSVSNEMYNKKTSVWVQACMHVSVPPDYNSYSMDEFRNRCTVLWNFDGGLTGEQMTGKIFPINSRDGCNISYNNHERATAVLLEYGADVSIQDDRGLTALDLARSRKMKKKLQEAWSEVINSRSTTNLGPIRAPSREDVRTSIEDLTVKRKKGEVIFDGMPANPFADANKKDSSATIASNRGLTRHSSLKEKGSRTDELENGSQLLSQFPKDGPRRLGQVRSMKPTPLPRTKSRSTERLPAISPDRISMPDRNLESPVHFNRNARARRSFEDKKVTGRGRRMTPLSTREGTVIGDELVFDRGTTLAPSPTPSIRHRRSDSDPRGTPNLLDIAASCDPYLQMQRRGRSYSMTANIPTDAADSNQHTPIQRETTVTSMQREATLMSVCSVRSDSRMSTNSNNSPRLLNLGQMLSNSRTPVQNAPLYGPSSSKVIPPTPTFITQRSLSRFDKHSESDTSPRSDDDVDIYKGVLENPAELIRTHTMFKDEFVLEESRPKDPMLQSGTPTDSGSSGGSSHVSSPRETPMLQLNKAAKSPRKSDKNNAQINGVKEKVGQQANLAGSVNVTKYKLNDKLVKSSKPANSGNHDSVRREINRKSSQDNNSKVPNTNAKSSIELRVAAMQNAAVNNANKTADTKSTSQTGGTVNAHSDTETSVKPASDVSNGGSGNASYNGGGGGKKDIDQKNNDSAINKQQLFVAIAPKKPTGKSASDSSVSKSTDNTVQKVSIYKKKQNTMQVVPTKLSERIINSNAKETTKDDSDKNGKLVIDSDVSDRKNSDNKTDVGNKPIVTETHQDNKLIKDNSVVTKPSLDKQASVNTNVAKEGEKEITSSKAIVSVQKPANTALSNKAVTNVQSANKSVRSINQSNSNRTVQQSVSAHPTSRYGAQSRNSLVNKTNSAGTAQRPTLTVKKNNSTPVPSKSPRVTNSLQRSNTIDNSATGKTSSGTTSSAQKQSDTAHKSNGSNDVSKSGNSVEETKSTKPSSPTDYVPSTVCRSTSMSKSYNMSSVQTAAKSSGNDSGRVKETSNATAMKPQVTNKDKKSSEVSKSTNDALSGSAKLTNTSSIVSKSISQMPSVGSVTKEATNGNKGLLRSSSMSTIEETKEKASSSSITTDGSGSAKKQRPASDGPAGLSGINDAGEASGKPIKPLIDVLPNRGASTKMNPNNYLNGEVHTTPVIVNPFEELEQKRAEEMKQGKNYLGASEFGFVVEKPGLDRSKTQSSIKSKSSKNSRKSREKPTSANSRASSGKRRRARSKDTSANKSDSESSRPKSGKTTKRCKSGKRKRKVPDGSLAKANEKSDVAIIGGIGWHLQTSCIDKSEVDAVIVSQFDSSDSDSEDTTVHETHVSPPRLEIPEPDYLPVNKPLESPSIVSPRFKEVRPFSNHHQDLPVAVNDGYPPMNLDMTQSSLSLKQNDNRSGVYIEPNLTDDINAFLSKIQEQESHEFDDIDDDDEDDDNLSDDYEDSMANALHRDIIMGKLTPIPESPAQTHTGTPSTLHHVARTVKAISNFDANVKDDDLNALLGSTPREADSSAKRKKPPSGSMNNSRNTSGSSSATRSQGKKEPKPASSTPASLKPSPATSAVSRTTKSGQSARSNVSDRNTNTKQGSAASTHNVPITNSSKVNVNKDKTSNTSSVKYEVSVHRETKSATNNKQTTSAANLGENDSNNGSNLKSLLAEKMQGIQRLLEESNSASRARAAARKRNYSQESENFDPRNNRGDRTPTNSDDNIELRLGNVNEDIVIDLTNRGLETERTDDDIKSTRSSRKERKFSETKTAVPDEDINEAIDEIFSNTFPSARSNLKSGQSSLNSSLRSRNSTLTEADRNVLAQMAKDNHASPFHAREQQSVRVSSSYDESGTLNKDNPELLQRFHADKFNLGQKVKAMIDAGADSARVKQMMKTDNEAKQLAKIMNSFRQMELYAGPHGTNNRSSSKKETPRKDHEVAKSFSHHASSVHKGMVPRPGSAGAGRIRTGKFTEIKEKGSTSSLVDKMQGAVPKKLAEEFERSPFRRVDSATNMDQLKKAVTSGSTDSDEDEKFQLDDTLDSRPDSACTTLSSQSSITEETIQWKKGNVLGKGAFGTVWCGLTSEGQLIAVKQIELNTNNHHKAKKEYEKVQEEVELLKTLEHRNIVGYLGTSLEDSIVSIFMQFVPGGSIASILARFGALDEAVFRKYTKQILEGVEYLHNNDVIHRDIKGGNVMLMPNGVIKLIDFGCAKRLCINLSMGQSEILKSMKGTPYWMAPEVVNETGHGKKSDIWSIGCTVFEMATRKPPWAEMNPMAAIFAIGSNKPVPQLPDRYTDEAREFVNCCLTKEQTKRLTATELLLLPFIRRKSRRTSSNC